MRSMVVHGHVGGDPSLDWKAEREDQPGLFERLNGSRSGQVS